MKPECQVVHCSEERKRAERAEQCKALRWRNWGTNEWERGSEEGKRGWSQRVGGW